jgi:hypothetical protein
MFCMCKWPHPSADQLLLLASHGAKLPQNLKKKKLVLKLKIMDTLLTDVFPNNRKVAPQICNFHSPPSTLIQIFYRHDLTYSDPWRWRRYVPLSLQSVTELPGVTTQRVLFIATAVKTSNPTYFRCGCQILRKRIRKYCRYLCTVLASQ